MPKTPHRVVVHRCKAPCRPDAQPLEPLLCRCRPQGKCGRDLLVAETLSSHSLNRSVPLRNGPFRTTLVAKVFELSTPMGWCYMHDTCRESVLCDGLKCAIYVVFHLAFGSGGPFFTSKNAEIDGFWLDVGLLHPFPLPPSTQPWTILRQSKYSMSNHTDKREPTLQRDRSQRHICVGQCALQLCRRDWLQPRSLTRKSRRSRRCSAMTRYWMSLQLLRYHRSGRSTRL